MGPALSDIPPLLEALRPHLVPSLHLLLSALVPIYAGAHASLARPSSAAPRRTRRKSKSGSSSSDSESDSDDEETNVMESLSPSDALLFPIMAACTLGGLYLVIKYYGAHVINRILGAYMGIVGVAGLGNAGADALRVLGGFVWPDLYSDGGLWVVRRGVVRGLSGTRASPLPGVLGRIKLGRLEGWAWMLREVMGRKWEVKVRAGRRKASVGFTSRMAVSMVAATVAVAWAYFVDCPWWLTNLQGFALVYGALQMVSTGTFGTGSLVLIALFFYDIYFVFYTPLMVSVATNLEVPIKMIVPRAGHGKSGHSMLGLGDIVLPGIMMGLALRFDQYMHYLKLQTRQDRQTVKPRYRSAATLWGERFWTLLAHKSAKVQSARGESTLEEALPSFKKTYFTASVVGYVLAMATTLVCMQIWQHAQPALLYLVPGVLGALWLTALARGEAADMWSYSELEDEPENEEDKKDANDKDAADKDDSIWSKAFSWSYWFGDEMQNRHDKVEKLVDESVKTEMIEKTTVAEKGPWLSISIRPEGRMRRQKGAPAAGIDIPAVTVTGSEAAPGEPALRRSTRSRKA